MSPERSVTHVSGLDRDDLVGAIGFEPTTPCAQGDNQPETPLNITENDSDDEST